MMELGAPRKVHIALVGIGVVGPRHAQSVADCVNASLVCLVDPSVTSREAAERFHVPLYASVQEMLQSENRPDAAIVCTPNRTHAVVSEELLAAGIHVLVEKPIATTIPSGRDLVETARQLRLCLLVGHHRRFNPYVTATKQAILDGAIGRPIAVSGLWATYKPPEYFQAPMEWHAKAGDGGPILINLIHDVDILQYLLGRIVRVHAEQTPSHRGHEAEEGAAILLRFASGAVGTFILSDAAPSPHTFEQGTGENPLLPRSGRDFYRIFGTEGTLSVGDMKISKYAKGSNKSWESKIEDTCIDLSNDTPFDEQVEHLVNVVRGVEEPRCSGEDGLSALVVCDAVRRAMFEPVAIEI